MVEEMGTCEYNSTRIISFLGVKNMVYQHGNNILSKIQ